MDTSKKTITLISENGNEEVEFLFAFVINDIQKEYVIYTKNEADENGNVTLYAASVNAGEKPILTSIASDDEWSKVKDVLRELSTDGDDSNGGYAAKTPASEYINNDARKIKATAVSLGNIRAKSNTKLGTATEPSVEAEDAFIDRLAEQGAILNKIGDQDHIKLINNDGTEEEIELLVSFEFSDTKKEYVVYTKNEKDENGNITIYSSTVIRDNGELTFGKIETEEEWNRIKNILRELSKKHGN